MHANYARIQRSFYPLLVALFTATLIVSNVCATKGVSYFTGSHLALGPVQLLPLNTDGAFFLYPLAYVIGDVLSEVYGFRSTRRAIYYGFAALVLAALCFKVSVSLPAAPFYANQDAFRTVIGTGPRLIIASLSGYVVGQLLNALTVVAIKERTKEHHLWARLIGSTVVGEFADTLLFCAIAAGAIGITTWHDFLNYFIVGFVWKSLVEIVVMPITYRVIAFVKAREPSYRDQPDSTSALNSS